MRLIALLLTSAATIASFGAAGTLTAFDALGTFGALCFAAGLCYGTDVLKRRRARN